MDIYHRTEWVDLHGDELPGATPSAGYRRHPGVKLACVWLQLALIATRDVQIGPRTLVLVQELDATALKQTALDIPAAREHFTPPLCLRARRQALPRAIPGRFA